MWDDKKIIVQLQHDVWGNARRLALALFWVGLAGCGGSEDNPTTGNDEPPPPPSVVNAVAGFEVVPPGVTTRVDLSTYVQGTGATLAGINSPQPGCRATPVAGLVTEITAEHGLCEFGYEVSAAGVNVSATLSTLASTKAAPLLPPLSQTMTLAESNKSFDLVALLGNEWPTGYALDPASLLVQGGSSQGTVTANGNVITYTPPPEPVWNQIRFVLHNPSKPDEDALGTLYVTVADALNHPPVIGKPQYDYTAQTSTPVITMQTVTLDLSQLPNLNITEPDAEEWQLIEVQSYSASVLPVDPNSVTNKQFTFQAATPGEHMVNYIVGDHEAGFAMGIIKIKVDVEESPKTWNDITIGPKTFQATPLYSEVIRQGVSAEAVYDDGVANNVAAVNLLAAQSYCSNGNHLARPDELDLLRSTAEADVERLKYPVERTYLVQDSVGQAFAYELHTGTKTPYDPMSSLSQYVICVDDSITSYIPFTTRFGIDTGLNDNTWWQLGTLISDGGAENPLVISSTNLGSTPITAANVQLNPPNCPVGICKVDVKGDATTYGQFTAQIVNAINPANTVNIKLTLLQNAKVAAATVGVNNSLADGMDANTIIVSITDEAGTPLANTQVKLKYSVSSRYVSVLPASCEDPVNCTPVTTDDSGNITLKLTSYLGAAYTLVFKNDEALVGGLPNSAQAPQ